MLDGSLRVDEVIQSAMTWDVMGGVARRAWARNQFSIETCIEYNQSHPQTDHLTLPFLVDDQLLKDV